MMTLQPTALHTAAAGRVHEVTSLCVGGQLDKSGVVLQATYFMHRPLWQELPTYGWGSLGQTAPVQETGGVAPRVERKQLRHLQRRRPRLDEWSSNMPLLR